MDAMEWLLETENPSVRFRTLAELLDVGKTEEALESQHAIPASAPVKKLLDSMHPEGYWLQKNQRTGRILGDGVEYGSFGTTHFCLSYCAELGLDKANPLVAKAAERYMGLQREDGDWLGHYSCLYAYNVRTLIRLGYRGDEHVQKSINLMLNTARSDGGYLCDMHEKPGRKPPKSCIRGSVKTLLAFAELPEYWKNERCLALVDYFLGRHGIFSRKDPARFVNDDIKRNAFPIIWRANVWEILYALSKMGYGNDTRLHSAWDVLESRKDPEGRWRLDWTPTQCPWKVGKAGEPNKWITFYCMLAKKYAGRGN
jgi:hypothetical protein